MKALKQLAQIINLKQLSLQEILTSQLSAQTKLRKFHKYLQDTTLVTDEAAIEKLYKKDTNAITKYRTLKYDLKKRLFNNILLYEFPKKTKEELRNRKAFFECQRTYTIAHFLILLNARNIAIPMLKDQVELMEEHEFTTLIVDSLKLIRQHAAIIEGDIEATYRYNDMLERWTKIQAFENKVDGLYYVLMANFSNKKADKKNIYTLAHHCYSQIKHSIPSNASSSIILKSKMIEIIMYKCANDLDSVIEICKDTILQLKARSYPSRPSIFMIYLQWINSTFQLNQVENTEQICENLISFANEADFNWFVGKKMAYQAAIYNKNYKNAAMIYLEVMKHKKELRQYKFLEEEWNIIAITMGILIKVQKIPTEVLGQLPIIRVTKKFNELSTATQDKEGKYAMLNLLQLVNLLLCNKYEYAEKHIVVYRQYQKKYLNGEEYERIYLFTKMASQLVKHRYDHQDRRASFELYLEKLSKTYTDNKYMELIPLENLWLFIWEQLQTSTTSLN